MKYLLLIISLILLSGCGEDVPVSSTTSNSNTVNYLREDKLTCDILATSTVNAKLKVISTIYNIVNNTLLDSESNLINNTDLELDFCILHTNEIGKIEIEYKNCRPTSWGKCNEQ